MQNAVLREAGGNVYACDHYVYSKYNLGNILNTTIAEIVNSARQRKFGTDKLDTLLSDSDGRIPAYLR